jgi:hypothetical protein
MFFAPSKLYFSTQVGVAGYIKAADALFGGDMQKTYEVASAILTAGEGSRFVIEKSHGIIQAVYQNPTLLYVAVGCFVVFTVVLCVALWRLWKNRTPRL